MADTTTATSNVHVDDELNEINETSSIDVTSSSKETSLIGKGVTKVERVAEGDVEKGEKNDNEGEEKGEIDENEGENEEEEVELAEKELRARVSLLVESLGPLAAARYSI